MDQETMSTQREGESEKAQDGLNQPALIQDLLRMPSPK